ncbi:hypothetical protein RJ639_045896 [Escallonia herrerae]|uniref:Reverse transcriptase RNase H-like domain-containing protein n=1 Tax=Escallonia herrerae TaxID=1293975 RepID=A0AA88W6U1_9ASTE|nr:hypothetical protein RJ639_045896 [Escallonia herrerae]
MKQAISENPTLVLPDVSKSFEVHIDSFDFALRRVLMQEGHPMAYESEKLNEAKCRYSIHEKELLAIVHCLTVWRHYLLGSSFVMQIDNTAVSHFLSQSKLTSKQVRWQELLVEFKEYRADSTNSIADALSRRAKLDQLALTAMNAIVRTENRVVINITKNINKALIEDPVAEQLLKLVESDKTQQFWQEDGLIRPQIGEDVQEYVKTCLTCQQDRVEQNKKAGLLQSLLVSTRLWESVTLDFVIGLQKGMPQDIVSDRDSHFTRNFWTELFNLFESQLLMSSSHHLKLDGHTEWCNPMLEEYFCHFVNATHKNWVKLLDVAQLCFDSRKSSSMGKTAFKIMDGQQPLLPHTANVPHTRKSPRAAIFSEEWRQNNDLAHSYLEKAARRMKKHTYKNRRSQKFSVGDKVMVKLLLQDSKFLRERDFRLLQKFEGPLTTVKKIGKMDYKVTQL